MYSYKVPASSGNLGIGFDTIGLSLNIYNYFKIESNSSYEFIGFLKGLKNKDNLFLHSYKVACKYKGVKDKPFKVILKNDIPVSRGLASSSSMIVGGLFAYNLMFKNKLTKEEMLALATKIEGHPDNVAPCIYGGLCINHKGKVLVKKISPKWKLSVLIPNYEVSTAKARKVIKQDIKLSDAVNNISASIFALDGLINFNDNIKFINDDSLHEPYRKKLIKDYNKCKKLSYELGAKAFLISGSGSTMLIISDKDIELNIKNIECRKVKVDYKGATCLKNY